MRLAAKCPSRETKRLRPESTGRVCYFYYAAHSGNEGVHLLTFNNQRRSHFQHHKVVPADLGQKPEITEEPHHQNLAEHSAMHGTKRFVWNAQSQLLRRLEFN